MDEKERELAKSYFALSQIFIILAGFLFTASSVAYTNSINSLIGMLNAGVNVVTTASQLNSTIFPSNNTVAMFSSFGDVTLIQAKMYIYYNIAGVISVLLSIISWILGHVKIKNSN